MITPQKIDILLSPSEMKDIFKKKANQIGLSSNEIKKVKIKTIKKYIDQRSFSLVALYSLNVKDKIIGIANSDGEKQYAFKANKLIFKHFSKINNDNYSVPEPYCYIESLGLFLEEYLEGKNFGDILKENKKIKNAYIERLGKLLSLLQKTNVVKSSIEREINFYDIKKNIKILKKREAKEEKEIDFIFKKIENKIRGYEKKNKNKVLAHGDFNPYNIFFEKNRIKIIDFGKTHIGDRVSDLANIFSHFETSLDFSFSKKDQESFKESLLISYQKNTTKLNEVEKEKLKMYENYFNLLNISHVMVWGRDSQKLRLSKRLKNLINKI